MADIPWVVEPKHAIERFLQDLILPVDLEFPYLEKMYHLAIFSLFSLPIILPKLPKYG
jgi:hypothetical protein